MGLAGTTAVTELWAKCKAAFGRRLGASTTTTTVSLQLKNNAGDSLGDAASIGAATSTAAGIMTADMYSKLDGIAAGATANTGTVTSVAAGVGLAGGSVTSSGTIKADLKSETALTGASTAETETSGRVYATVTDKDGHLATVVPWTDTTALSSMSGTLAVSQGGTGATSAADARTGLDVYSKSEVDALVVSGGASFKGTVPTDYTQAQIEAASYVAGWYWVVDTAGTYVGQTCEVGDMIFAKGTKSSSYSASDFTVVQNNITEMTAAEVEAICV